VTDLQTCTRITGDRQVSGSSATALTALLLTRVDGWLPIMDNAFLASINIPVLTRSDGYLSIVRNAALSTFYLPSLNAVYGLAIHTNAVLATINLPSLSSVAGELHIRSNPSLTFAHLPKLTFIGWTIHICQNNGAFLIPSGPPDAPAGGLTSNQYKYYPHCDFQQGAGTCSRVTCP
jgi:hypothetical protein